MSAIKYMLDSQMFALDEIAKATGQPTLREMLGNPEPEPEREQEELQEDDYSDDPVEYEGDPYQQYKDSEIRVLNSRR